jgi:hypothetical protein
MGSFQYPQTKRGCGKVDSPLNEKLQSVEWGEYKLDDLFEILSSKNIYHANEIDKIFDNQVSNSYPYVVRTTQNNGIRGYIIEDELYANDENTLSFAQDTFSVFYQKQKYFTGNKVKVLKAKFDNQNERIMQYLTASFQKALSTFTWGIGSTVETIAKTKIQLPIKNGEINFSFMEKFIAELEAERIAELEAYLVATGLKDYVLTDEEQKVLEEFEQGKIKFQEFLIGELFEINSYKKRFDANKVFISEVGKPYVVRTSLNNGIRGYINEDEEYLNDGNTISFGQDTATMFYQANPYFTGDKIKIVKSKDERFNKLNGLFFIATMTKSFSTFSWGSSSFSVKIIENQQIEIPIQNKKSDYETMNTFISAIQKQVIKEVVLYVDEKKGLTYD